MKRSPRRKKQALLLPFILVTLTIILTFGFLQSQIKITQDHATSNLQKNYDQFVNLLEIEKRRLTPLKLPILLYHYIEIVTNLRDTIRQSLNINPQIFESQINTLLTHGYQPIVMSDLIDYFDGKKALPSKPIIFTFDDGYRDFYTDVLPILKKYHIKVMLYVSTGLVDSTRNYLTQPQLKEVIASGLVEIGAHSVTHSNLRYLNLAVAKTEILESKQELEKLTGQKVKHFAFPYGDYSSDLILELGKAGFDTAVTVDPGTTQTYAERFSLKRIRPGRTTDTVLLKLIE